MNFVKETIKGIFIGIANIIPGVSGGTMAVSMGIYDKIISAVTNFLKDFKKSIVTLLPYIVGMLLGIVGLSFVIEPMFEKYPVPTAMAFIGLILGGLPILWKKIDKKSIGISNVIVFVIFFAAIIALQYFGAGRENTVEINLSVMEVIKLFFIGIIASATMVIPGVSGSMILMILGYYLPVISAIKEFVKAVISFNGEGILLGIGILVPFGIGVVLGIFVIAKLIEILLKKWEGLTYSAILGLVVSAPFAIFMELGAIVLTPMVIFTSILTLIIGVIIAVVLGK